MALRPEQIEQEIDPKIRDYVKAHTQRMQDMVDILVQHIGSNDRELRLIKQDVTNQINELKLQVKAAETKSDEVAKIRRPGRVRGE